MRLASAVLGFVFRKTGLFAAVLLSLFLGLLLTSALVPALRKAEVERHRLQQVSEERASLEKDLGKLRRTYAAGQTKAVGSLKPAIDAEIDQARRDVAQSKRQVSDRRKARDKVCGPIRKFIENHTPLPDTCRAKQKLYDAAVATEQTLEKNLGRAEKDAAILRDDDLSAEQKLDRLGADGALSPLARQIDTQESRLGQKKAEEKSLRAAQGSWSGWVVNVWHRSWRWLVVTALLLVLMPGVLRTLSYFVLMPMVSRVHRPMQLAGGSSHPSARLHTAEARRTLTVELPVGEVMSARSEHVRPVRGKVRSRLLYDWSSPFISFAAGLYGLSRITGDEQGTSATLATPSDPDSYLMRIDFADHPGLVIHPKHVVGVIGAPDLYTRWQWGIQSFATWQVRYILFAGTGSLIVQGLGDVVATSPGGRSTRMEQNLVMGFDSRLSVGVRRTEVFWPYLWGRTPLVDSDFTGHHELFWQKSTVEGPTSPIAKTFDVFFSALGKVLGF
ncbi:hypothetical protein [Nocardioides mangrovicus]|uniref:hypothetical protein n=1 Tax=Nocardioides mangrovicus TaxID=2478913 RepID=UPI001314CAB9|nr:hypothetical protein [Nocardioides mangrovicus]